MIIIYLSNLKTAIIIPVKNFDKSKTRLSPFLSLEQRKVLCNHLVMDLLYKISRLQESEIILITDESINMPKDMKQEPVIIKENGTQGVNSAIALADPYINTNDFDQSIVIPIDIPLLDVTELSKLVHHSKKFKEGICIVPSYRFDGTNVLLRKPHSVIHTSYDNNSFFNHFKNALEKGVDIEIFDSGRMNLDIDNVEDINILLRKYFFIKTLVPNSLEKNLSHHRLDKNGNAIDYLLQLLADYHQNY
ncbi:2-phospho-L-lactate guanylyltransferase [Candidatus Nitrosocosmicus sp. SS]|nr:2-phospho-L-lactate guanylyltransferase [Candidatus Nitrosocosmicus sp. SS]KAF0869713.1 2-phospho-L-lactate guanylyltransferase [Candidatus Nitrosocosmicus sp. SS]